MIVFDKKKFKLNVKRIWRKIMQVFFLWNILKRSFFFLKRFEYTLKCLVLNLRVWHNLKVKKKFLQFVEKKVSINTFCLRKSCFVDFHIYSWYKWVWFDIHSGHYNSRINYEFIFVENSTSIFVIMSKDYMCLFY